MCDTYKQRKNMFDFLEGNVFYLSLYLYFTSISCYYKTWNITWYEYGKHGVDDTSQVFKPQIVNCVIFEKKSWSGITLSTAEKFSIFVFKTNYRQSCYGKVYSYFYESQFERLICRLNCALMQIVTLFLWILPLPRTYILVIIAKISNMRS